MSLNVNRQTFADEAPYVFKEPVLGADVSVDVLLSMPNRDQLFKGKTFYVTPSVVPCRSVLREIIEASGGRVTSQRKSLKTIAEVNQKEDNYKYVVISCTADLHLVADLIKNKIGTFFFIFIIIII